MHDRKLGTYKHDAKGLICLIGIMWSRYCTYAVPQKYAGSMQAPLAAEMENVTFKSNELDFDFNFELSRLLKFQFVELIRLLTFIS